VTTPQELAISDVRKCVNFCRQPDPLADDQVLFFDSEAGVIVLLGCTHAGVANTLAYVRRLTNGRAEMDFRDGQHRTPEIRQ